MHQEARIKEEQAEYLQSIANSNYQSHNHLTYLEKITRKQKIRCHSRLIQDAETRRQQQEDFKKL